MYVYLTAHMREGISARPGVTGGVTGSGGTSNTHVTDSIASTSPTPSTLPDQQSSSEMSSTFPYGRDLAHPPSRLSPPPGMGSGMPDLLRPGSSGIDDGGVGGSGGGGIGKRERESMERESREREESAPKRGYRACVGGSQLCAVSGADAIYVPFGLCRPATLHRHSLPP
jgi:hypothetical protein